MRLIDSDALFDKVYEFYGNDNEDNENWMMGIINDAPTIDAVPVVHGEWMEMEVIQDERDARIPEWQQARCSVCGKWHTTPYMYCFDDFNYCPNCGAKMEVQE